MIVSAFPPLPLLFISMQANRDCGLIGLLHFDLCRRIVIGRRNGPLSILGRDDSYRQCTDDKRLLHTYGATSGCRAARVFEGLFSV